MKKILTLLLILTMVATTVFAVVNDQKVYSVTDDVYSNIETLYIASGYGIPSSSGPWTGSELLNMMKKIDRDSLVPVYQKIYDQIMSDLNPRGDFEFDTVSFDFGLELNLEGYLRSNAARTAAEYEKDIAESTPALTAALKCSADIEKVKEALASAELGVWTRKFVNSEYFVLEDIATGKTTVEGQYQKFIGLTLNNKRTKFLDVDNLYNGKSEWIHGEDFRSPFLKLSAETWAAKNFYGYFELAFGDNAWAYQYQKKFDTNIDFLTKYQIKNTAKNEVQRFGLLSWQTPQKALVSAGGNNWSLIAGRDKLSWGAGETGNLMLSKSFDNHTFAQFTTYHDVFNYTLLGTYYPYYPTLYTTVVQEKQGDVNWDQNKDSEMQTGFKSLLAHRLEFSFWKNRINFDVTESIMIRKLKDEPFNIAMINPFGFFHNEYTRTNTNSLLVFEADITPINGLNVYGQFALDDFSIPGAADDGIPDANGFMLGVKGTKGFNYGILTVNGELVKTSPYLYLRGVYGEDYGSDKAASYGLGFDAVTRYYTFMSEITATNDFITYTYGNDKIVFNLKADYEIPSMIKFGMAYTGITSGVMNINSPWGYDKNIDTDITTPTKTDPMSGKTGEIEKTNIFTFTVDYQTPIKGLSVSTIADVISIKNWNNKKDATFRDVQVTMGAKYCL